MDEKTLEKTAEDILAGLKEIWDTHYELYHDMNKMDEFHKKNISGAIKVLLTIKELRENHQDIIIYSVYRAYRKANENYYVSPYENEKSVEKFENIIYENMMERAPLWLIVKGFAGCPLHPAKITRTFQEYGILPFQTFRCLIQVFSIFKPFASFSPLYLLGCTQQTLKLSNDEMCEVVSMADAPIDNSALIACLKQHKRNLA